MPLHERFLEKRVEYIQEDLGTKFGINLKPMEIKIRKSIIKEK
jgi:hypothetical protein